MTKIFTALLTLLALCIHVQAIGQSAWSTTYHPNGLLSSIDGPRTDIDASGITTTLSYSSQGWLRYILFL